MKLELRLFIVVGLISISACSNRTPASHSDSTSPCEKSGTIGSDRVPDPTRGFEISFQYYLPPCYGETEHAGFPVLYLIAMPYEARLDGGANTPMSLADRLIRAGKFAPVILVAPEATVGSGYHAALAIDLVPYVDKKFNTISNPRYRGAGGISHGAGIAARMVFQYSELFGSLGVFSGGIDASEKGAFASWIDPTPSENWPRVLIDVGDQDGIMPLTENLLGFLDSQGVPYTLNRGEGGHSWTYWSDRMELYLLWFAAAWSD